MEKSIAGPLAGKNLKKITSIRTSWKSWTERNPQTTVLSTDTGYERNYSRDPYEGYYRSLGIWFPVGDVRKDLSPKEMVLGIEMGREARAYPLSKLKEEPGLLRDKLGEETIQIEVAPDGGILRVTDNHGEEIPSIFAYWFAWQAFHPETTVYREED
ncbi:MAG: DUF3179 domain-containing protein [Proteobacteria bacterium]|nr:DUF3179 domain-containing protein [Pseudomonadota bacterium]NIS67424.1 DUF3179 domain-containing protein [Pseudomonadota bacterium]